MALSIAHFATDAFDCPIRRVATHGHERKELWHCARCDVSMFAVAPGTVPQCAVSKIVDEQERGDCGK